MVRKNIPYGRQWVDEDDLAAVLEVLRSDWLTTGPKVGEFEEALARFVGAADCIAVTSGTAALHAAMYALGIGPGDEVIVPPLTFAATANCVVFQGGTPVFADVDAQTLLLDPEKTEAKITPRTKAIIAVDYAGQPCDYDVFRDLTDRHGLALVADACHSLGGSYKGRPVGSLADLNIFSFHPVKPITTGEGGAITTNDENLAQRLRLFRNHGITSDHYRREQEVSWFYEMVDLGYNYRLTDFQCALGISQMKKLPGWLARRQDIARLYDEAFAPSAAARGLSVSANVVHAYHLYVILLNLDYLSVDRGAIFRALRKNGIGVNVHYIPVHLHPFYRQRFGTGPGLCPVAEQSYELILSMPIFPKMNDDDLQYVLDTTLMILNSYRKPS
jgi:perosamine synthetase